MKKIAIVISMMFAGAVSAAEVSTSYVHDYETGKNGARIELPVGSVYGIKPVLGVSYVDESYTRYSAGADYQVVKLGPVALSVAGSAVFQDSRTGSDGFGLTAGVKVSMPVTKSVDVVSRVDRFFGQNRIAGFDGNVVSVGLAVKF